MVDGGAKAGLASQGSQWRGLGGGRRTGTLRIGSYV